MILRIGALHFCLATLCPAGDLIVEAHFAAPANLSCLRASVMWNGGLNLTWAEKAEMNDLGDGKTELKLSGVVTLIYVDGETPKSAVASATRWLLEKPFSADALIVEDTNIVTVGSFERVTGLRARLIGGKVFLQMITTQGGKSSLVELVKDPPPAPKSPATATFELDEEMIPKTMRTDPGT